MNILTLLITFLCVRVCAQPCSRGRNTETSEDHFSVYLSALCPWLWGRQDHGWISASEVNGHTNKLTLQSTGKKYFHEDVLIWHFCHFKNVFREFFYKPNVLCNMNFHHTVSLQLQQRQHWCLQRDIILYLHIYMCHGVKGTVLIYFKRLEEWERTRLKIQNLLTCLSSVQRVITAALTDHMTLSYCNNKCGSVQ